MHYTNDKVAVQHSNITQIPSLINDNEGGLEWLEGESQSLQQVVNKDTPSAHVICAEDHYKN